MALDKETTKLYQVICFFLNNVSFFCLILLLLIIILFQFLMY